MTWETSVLNSFKENEIEVVSYLPGSAIDGLIQEIEDDPYFTTVRVTREEEAVGVVSGAWLTHSRGVLLCQSSGVANALNPLTSLNKAARIPFIGLVVRRGDLGEFNFAQVPFGYELPDVLDAIGVRYRHLEAPEEVEQVVDMAAKTAFSTEDPYILLLETVLTGAKDEY